MKYYIILLVLITFSPFGSAQTKIDAEKVQKLKSENKNIQLVDLRTTAEIDKTGKIEGAMLINYSASDFESQIVKLNKEYPIILYCAAGGRSAKTAAILSQKGYKTIYDYSGGMTDWVAKGYKVVK